MASLDEGKTGIVEVVEVVGSMRDGIAVDIEKCKVLENGLLKLSLIINLLALLPGRDNMPCTYALLGRVSVIKANEKLALVHFGEVLVQHRGLRVSDVQIARWLGRETSYDLTLDRIRQTEREGSGGLRVTRLTRFRLCRIA